MVSKKTKIIIIIIIGILSIIFSFSILFLIVLAVYLLFLNKRTWTEDIKYVQYGKKFDLFGENGIINDTMKLKYAPPNKNVLAVIVYDITDDYSVSTHEYDNIIAFTYKVGENYKKDLPKIEEKLHDLYKSIANN